MSHKITRQAALIEIEGEVLVVKLSAEDWSKVLAIAASEGGGQLPVARCPNQTILDVLHTPAFKLDFSNSKSVSIKPGHRMEPNAI
jgi:hypothetical protein